jgi:hypothetical protein
MQQKTGRANMLRSVLLLSSSFLLASLSLGGSAFAADLPLPQEMDPSPPPTTLDLPAVSAPNGKASLFGGGLDSDAGDGELAGGMGSFSIPIGERFGLQGDAFAESASGELVAGGAAHLFWRDPSVGLLGAYGGGAVNELANFDSVRGGIEGEAYLGRISFEGLLGWEHMDFDAGGNTDEVFALADIALYATDDFRVSAGYRHWNDINMAAFGAEYQLPMQWGGTSAALFAEGRIGEDSYKAIWGGLRFYFGPEPKSLIRRHREDDPRGRTEDQAGNPGTPPSVTSSRPLTEEEQCVQDGGEWYTGEGEYCVYPIPEDNNDG